MNKNRRHGGSVPVLSAMDAVAMIEDGSVVAVVGAGGGITEPTKLIDGLAERFKKTGEPKNLTFWHATGLGDRGDRGMSPFAQQGLVKRVIGGHWGQSPRLAEMAERGEIEAYCLPQGTMSQLLRTAAAG
ncbi:MAG: CoA-transferase, partial [Synergistaceae bacterium]